MAQLFAWLRSRRWRGYTAAERDARTLAIICAQTRVVAALRGEDGGQP